MEWLCNHQIGITSLTFTSNFTKGELTSLLTSLIRLIVRIHGMVAFLQERGPMTSVRLALRKGIEELDASTFRRCFLFLRVLEISPHLQSIHIANCSTLHSNTNEGKARLLKHIAKMCPLIKKFTLSYCDENVAPYIFDFFPQLSNIQFCELFAAAHNHNTPVISRSSHILDGLRLYPNITHIKSDYLSPSLAQKFACCPNLQVLELTANDDDELSDDIMDLILRHCSMINQISILFPSNQGISENICRSIANHCQSHLRHLQLTNCVRFTASMARILSPIIQNLVKFSWDSIGIEEEALNALLKLTCRSMECFQLGDDLHDDDEHEIDDEADDFDEVSNDEEDEEEDEDEETAATLGAAEEEELVSQPPNEDEEDLDLLDNPILNDVRLTKADIVGITLSCPKLRHIKIKYPTPGNEVLSSLHQNCLYLQSLEVNFYQSISGETMKNFLIGCKQLTSLHLTGGKLSSEALISLAQHNQHLQVVTLRFSDGLPKISAAVTLQANPHELHNFTIQSSRGLDLYSLSYLVASFGRVRYFDIKCRSFTNVSSSLFQLHVSYLRLHEIARLLDYQLIFLAKSIRRLQKLSLSSCPYLTAISLTAIASTMEATLRSVSVDDCDMISEDSVAQLLKAFPSMRISIDDEENN
jgi:hypothetical protein